MKKWFILITLMVVGALFVPAVSADPVTIPLIDSDTESTSYFDIPGASTSSGSTVLSKLTSFRVHNVEEHPYLKTVYIKLDVTGSTGGAELWHERDSKPETVDFYLLGTETYLGRGTVTYNAFYNLIGSMYCIQYWVDIDEINFDDLTGTKDIETRFSENSPYHILTVSNRNRANPAPTTDSPVSFLRSPALTAPVGYYIVNEYFDWSNIIEIDSDYITLIRGGDLSTINMSSQLGLMEDTGWDDRTFYVRAPLTWSVINSRGTVYSGSYPEDTGSPDPDNSALTIYIQNSQTGALIADAHLSILAATGDPSELFEVVNRTLPGGTASVDLQPTGGGMPNPEYYRVIVTADGYNAEMPYADITLDAGIPMTMVMGMHPTAGGPEDPNKTFIDVYVRDIYANPIADATVKMGTDTLQTNSAGYTVFDMPVNSVYSYTITKPGYIPVEGTVTVADAPRYPVNIVMGLGVIPTNPPTTGPVVTPTKPIGEETPGTGFMEESGQAMASFFGVPLAIGKMILGMLLALAIGMTTAKQLKGGAQEFGIGLLGGAMLGVVIGLIPTWVIVVLLLTVGLYIGKMYMSGGAGGR